MKIKHLKPLLKHIIREVNRVNTNPINENFAAAPQRDYNDPKVVAHSIYQPVYLTRYSYKDKDGGDVYEVLLFSANGPRHAIKRDTKGNWFYLRDHDRKWVSADAYITPPKDGGKVPEAPKTGPLNIGPLQQEMIANKNVAPEPMGAVNVESIKENLNYRALLAARELAPKYFGGHNVKSTELKHHDRNREILTYEVNLINGEQKYLVKDRNGRWFEKIAASDIDTGRAQFKPIDLSKLMGGPIGQVEKPARAVEPPNVAKKWEPHGMPDLKMKKEQSVSSGAGAYSTPFAFKKKKIHEVSSFESKVRSKIHGVSKSTNEKTLPDGKYADDMLDGGRMKRAEGLNEDSGVSFSEIPEKSYFRIPGYDNLFQKIDKDTALNHGTGGMLNKPNSFGRKGQRVNMTKNNDILVHVNEDTSSGAVFSGGPTIQTPAWGTKNRLGSPKAIKASQTLGYKVVKSITDEKK